MSNRKKLPPITRLKYHKGDLVIKEGDYGTSIYKIISGYQIDLKREVINWEK